MENQGKIFESQLLNKKVVESVEYKLKAAGCSYYIRTPEGDVYQSGDLTVKEPKTSRRNAVFPHGAMSNIYRSKIDNLKEGQLVVFEKAEYGEFPTKHFFHGVMKGLVHRYGKESCEGAYDEKTGRMEFRLERVTKTEEK